MKIKILSGIAALLLVACSGEDTAGVNDTGAKSLPAEKELNTVTEYDGNVASFENNKMASYLFRGGDWELNFTYNADGNLSGMTQTNAQGEIVFDRVVSYDSNGKIISKNDSTYYPGQTRIDTENITYTYNNDNTVTVNINNNLEGIEVRTYHFDAVTGKVIKITKGGYVQQEMEYNGNNIVKIGTTNYIYDATIPVKGQYLNRYRNQFATYQNFVLYNGYSVPNAITDNYVVATDGQWASEDNTYTFEFDEDGYPVSETVLNVQGENPYTTLITYK